MDTTAKEIAIWAQFRIKGLAESTFYKNNTAMYNDLAETAGLSPSLVRHFHQGINKNLSADNLDKLVFAIKKAMSKAA